MRDSQPRLGSGGGGEDREESAVVFARRQERLFGQPSLHQLGFVQQFGVGIQISRDRLAQNGNPPLEFQASVAAVAAIVKVKR